MPLFSQIESLANWLVNPWLFVAGTAAVLVPILIHLLNPRKLRIVDWAAMEFLLEADQKTRRRIRLENLLLLVLRCLAVFLIGLLLARPFVPTSATAGLMDAAQYERIVLLDDSLSMQTRLGSESSWEIARQRLLDLTRRLVQERSDNSLTLILTSQPDRRYLNAAPLNPSSIDDISTAIERLEAGDGVANLDAALEALGNSLSAQPRNVNRVIYLFTDLRRRDWADAYGEGPVHKLIQLAKQSQGSFIIDSGDDEDRNLTLVEVRPEAALVQGVPSAFDCLVKNQGTTPVSDVRVKFSAGEALPLEATIERLAPGETASLRFNFTFTGDDFNFTFTGDDATEDTDRSLPPRQVKVEAQSAQHGADDRLPADSVAYFPARLARGVPALIIDGDPSTAFGRAESFYLRRALSPAGPIPSGIATEIVTESELESVPLDKYQIIFLLNNYGLGEKTEDNIRRLEKWVAAGGGLIIMPGDQIDEQFFNAQYWRNGRGLSPLKLERINGDEQERTWVNFRIADTNHEVLKQFAGQSNPLLENVKVFGWWSATVRTDQLGKEVAVPARFSDADESPAIAEKAFGKGRVVAFSIPADADWHNWPSDPSFLLIAQDFTRYLAADRGSRGLLRVGEPIRQTIDVAEYELDAVLRGPRDLKANLKAAAPAEGDSAAGQPTNWQVEHPATNAQGFYELTLARRDGGSDRLLFAANVDPSEGDLRRVDRRQLERELAQANVKIVGASQAASLEAASERSEVWWYLLWVIVAVLSAEQVMGWSFGRARS